MRWWVAGAVVAGLLYMAYPYDALALCHNGKLSTATKGACSWNGGVWIWLVR